MEGFMKNVAKSREDYRTPGSKKPSCQERGKQYLVCLFMDWLPEMEVSGDKGLFHDLK